jgi:hypothetical protein
MTLSEIDAEYAAMPSWEHVYYGVPVAPYIEDSGVLVVAGHGRRSLAALHAYCRGKWSYKLDPSKVTAKWVSFVETCGCTEEQHAAHLAAQRDAYLKELRGEYLDDDFPGCGCANPGLPPCETDMFAWRTKTVEPGTPGAIAALEVA